MKKVTISTKALFIAIMIYGAIVSFGCKKDVASGRGGGFGNAPRKEVPDPFVGDFMYVTSTGGYVDQSGHQIPGVSQGVSYHINKDGTGTSLYHAETGSYSGAVTTDEIRNNCTFEITKTNESQANIIIHFVSGKNYHNGVLLHDVEASKLYPNGDAVYEGAEFGTNDQGKTYFIVGTGNNTAQFTQQ
jgi:hypothetical protein